MDSHSKQLFNFIAAQTVSNECFTHSVGYIEDMFKVHLDTKYKEIFTANRKRKKELEAIKANELKKFNAVVAKYIDTTNKMVRKFDDWDGSDNLNEKIDRIYDALE